MTSLQSVFPSYLTAETAFSSAIRFDKSSTIYAEHTVTGPLSFTVNSTGAFAGASAIVRLVADGTNAPTFTGFKKTQTSSNYANIPGTLNTIRFRSDGSDYWYEISQEASIPAYSPASPETIKNRRDNTVPIIFFLGGQSNWKAGSAGIVTGPVPTGKTWNPTAKAFENYSLGLDPSDNFRPNPAPTLYLSTRLEQLYNAPVWVVEAGEGSTGFEAGAGEWAVGGGLRTTLAENIRESLQHLKDNNIDHRLGAMIFIQGERDANEQARADVYSAQFRNFVVDVKAQTTFDLPFISVRLNANVASAANADTLAKVRAAHEELSDRWVNVDDIPLATDGIHYEIAGYQAIGERLADLVSTIPLTMPWQRSYAGLVGRELLAAETTSEASEAILGLNVSSPNNTSLSFGLNNFDTLAPGNDNNTAVAINGMPGLTTGDGNTGVGFNPLAALTTGFRNFAAGSNPLQSLATGDNNTAIGNNPLQSLTTGTANTVAGNNAIKDITSGDNNTIFGNSAMLAASGQIDNMTVVGALAARNYTGSNSIFIGFEAGFNAGSVSNLLQIANARDSALISGNFANNNVALGTDNGNYGQGQGCVLIAPATTVPTQNPAANHVLLYIDGGRLAVRQSDGTVGFVQLGA